MQPRLAGRRDITSGMPYFFLPCLQVVVVAEDGVTTSRYPIQFTLVESAETLAVAEAEGGRSNNTAVGQPGRGEAGLH